MKKLYFMFFIVSNILFSQNLVNNSLYEFNLLGGFDTEKFSDFGGALYLEGSKNITNHLYAKLSVGYLKSISTNKYNIKTYKYVSIEDYEKYHTISYNVKKTEYQSIPFSIGLEYYIQKQKISPYLFFNINYSFIDPLIFNTPERLLTIYATESEIPQEYKKVKFLPNNSYGISFGLGSKYQIFSKFQLNIRYLYNIDSEIINTHQLLFGFSI
jgi:hypothetical protein